MSSSSSSSSLSDLWTNPAHRDNLTNILLNIDNGAELLELCLVNKYVLQICKSNKTLKQKIYDDVFGIPNKKAQKALQNILEKSQQHIKKYKGKIAKPFGLTDVDEKVPLSFILPFSKNDPISVTLFLTPHFTASDKAQQKIKHFVPDLMSQLFAQAFFKQAENHKWIDWHQDPYTNSENRYWVLSFDLHPTDAENQKVFVELLQFIFRYDKTHNSLWQQLTNK